MEVPLSFLILILVVSIQAAPQPSIVKDVDERLECQCGSSTPSKRTRVVGGADAVKGQFPYATGLIFHREGVTVRDSSLPLPYCGGTLITDRHILTAAHCLRGRTADNIYLDVGDYNLETKDKILRSAKLVQMHPGYVASTFQNDVGIIEMDEPVDWTAGMRASWLASPETNLDEGTKVTVYGWGRLKYTGGRPNILQSLDIPVMRNDECQKGFQTVITDGMLCAGGEEGHDACIGDSGSGLTVRLDNKYALVGVVSFGRSCGLPDVGGVYTRLGHYMDWIYDETRNSTCKPCIT